MQEKKRTTSSTNMPKYIPPYIQRGEMGPTPSQPILQPGEDFSDKSPDQIELYLENIIVSPPSKEEIVPSLSFHLDQLPRTAQRTDINLGRSPNQIELALIKHIFENSQHYDFPDHRKEIRKKINFLERRTGIQYPYKENLISAILFLRESGSSLENPR